MSSEVDEERALEGLCKVVREHAEGGAVLDHDDAALDEVVEPKVPDAAPPRGVHARLV